jgi:hypothetical protein
MFTLYHTNRMDTAVLSGGSWQPNLPLANLYSPSTTKRTRSVNAQLTSTQLRVTLTESISVRGIQIVATNLSSAAMYRITWYTDDTFSAQDSTTGWISVGGSSIDWNDSAEWLQWEDPDFWGGSEELLDPDNQGIDIRHNFASPESLQFVKIEFDDTTNSKGFVEIGYIFIGQSFIPTYNVSPDPTYGRESLTTVVQAVGGSQYFNRRGSRKRLQVTWQLLPKEEAFGEIEQIIRIHDVDRPVYVDLDPDNVLLDSGRTTAFLARIAQLPQARLLSAYLNNDTGAAVGFEFIQVI